MKETDIVIGYQFSGRYNKYSFYSRVDNDVEDLSNFIIMFAIDISFRECKDNVLSVCAKYINPYCFEKLSNEGFMKILPPDSHIIFKEFDSFDEAKIALNDIMANDEVLKK